MSRVPLSAGLTRTLWICVLAGAVTFAAGLLLAPQRAWLNLLLVSFYLLSLALGGAVFIAFQYITGAAWGVAIRRLPEALAQTLPLGAAGVLLVLLVAPWIYPWATPAPGEHTAHFREIWLNLPLVRGRAVLYLLAWAVLVWAMLRESRRQDGDGRVAHTYRNRKLAAGFLVVFGLTFWLASVDWIMSLEPQWFSTIFGLYNFAGLFVGGLAAITLMAVELRQSGPLRDFVRLDHLHDLSKLMLGFTTVWAYLWFCQFMLIWYANIPEETVYYLRRTQGLWAPLFYLNVILNWALPFLILMTRAAKRSPELLMHVAVLLLAGRWLDLYLMVMPGVVEGGPQFGVWEIGMVVGAVGVYLLGLLAALRRHSLVPVNDPQLEESLHYHA